MARMKTKLQLVLDKLAIDYDALAKEMGVSKAWLKLALRSTTVQVEDKHIKAAEKFIQGIVASATKKKPARKKKAD